MSFAKKAKNYSNWIEWSISSFQLKTVKVMFFEEKKSRQLKIL